MSRTTLFGIQDGKVDHAVREYHNGSRSAPLIWSYIAAKHGMSNPTCSSDKDMKTFWALGKPDSALTPDDRALLQATYDHAVIKASDAKAFLQVILRADFDAGNFMQIAHDMYALADRYEGFCMQQTSVSENVWEVAVPCEKCGCTCEGETRPYDLNEGSDHFYVEVPAA